MPRISTHIDFPPIRLAPGAVGSTQLADRSVTRAKLAESAVGTFEHGTLNLAKGIGTVGNLDVGTLFISYGSAGTWAGGIARARYGSFTGSVSTPFLRSARGSFGASRGSFAQFGRFASRTGGAGMVSSTVFATTGTFSRLVATGGTVRGRSGSFFGTLQAPLHIGQRGSFLGTVTGPLHRGGMGSFGTVRAALLRGVAYGSFGTVAAPVVRGAFGSFARFAGTFAALRLTSGVLAAGRLRGAGTLQIGSFAGPFDSLFGIDVSPRGELWMADRGLRYAFRIGTVALRAGTLSRFGTVQIGSFRTLGTTRGIAISPVGQVWFADFSGNYVYRVGTLALRAGTNSRQGTQRIGSFRNMGNNVYAIAFESERVFWLNTNTPLYTHRMGTLALRGGTDRRQGTRRIGSFALPGGARTGIDVSERGDLWLASGDLNNALVIGTVGLRGGTNSRFGTYAIGTMYMHGAAADLGFDGAGRAWITGDGVFDGVRVVGTPTFAESHIRPIHGDRLILRGRDLPPVIGTVRSSPSPDTQTAPPGTLSFLAWVVQTRPTVTLSSGAAIRQARRGTLAHIVAPAAANQGTMTMYAMLMPNYGSWICNTDTNGTPALSLFFRRDDIFAR